MWVFNERHAFGVETDPTQGEFFVNNDIDRNSALVRETVQNSLDARRDDATRVTVRFAFHGGALLLDSRRVARYVEALVPHLRACGADMDAVGLDQPRFLVVEDFGTHGLRGRTDAQDPSDFYFFWHVVGRSGKGDLKAGRWGLGKTVFPNSSQLSAFFGYSRRSDDRRGVLLGQTCLKTHEIDGRTYLPYAFYQNSGPRTFELPFDESQSDLVAQFRADFRLTRTDEPGLSVVVPFPYPEITEPDLIQAAIVHYFVPILAGQLVIQVNEQTLDAESILPMAERLRSPRLRDMTKALAFAREIRNLPPSEVHAVDAPEVLQAGGLRFSADAFSPARADRMRTDFGAGRILAVRIPVTLEPRSGPVQTTFVTVYLKYDPLLHGGHDFYLRGGISLSGQSVFGSRPALGLLAAEDPPICRFLGDAENPAHTLWNPRSSRLAARYRRAYETVRFLREAMVGLLDMLTLAPAEEDRHALSEIFFTTRRGERTERDRLTQPRPAPDLAGAGETPRYAIHPIQGGFCLKPGPGLKASDLPLPLSVQVAYEIRQGNPFKKYASHDFRLDRPPVTVRAEGVTGLRCQPNRLDVTLTDPCFVVEASGFDKHRDLKVKVEERNDAS